MFFKKNKNKIDSVVHSPTCKSCGKPSAHIEVVAPKEHPKASKTWSKEQIDMYQEYRDINSYYLLYSGPGGSNGMIGDAVSLERLELLKRAFSKPYNEAEMREQFYDMAGYCGPCQSFYCPKHWGLTSTELGTCPEGHQQSLDPHWSPDTL